MLGGEVREPDQVWIDSGYQGQTDGLQPVYAFCREQRDQSHCRYRPMKGFGETDGRLVRYQAPTKESKEIVHLGEQYHFTADRPAGVYRVDVNADHWKTFLQERLSVPLASPPTPGTLTLFSAVPKDHTTIAKHFTAEKQVEEYVVGKGVVRKWVRERKANHYFDAAYVACAAGHFCGVRLLQEATPPPVEQPSEPTGGGIITPDGRPFFLLSREES